MSEHREITKSEERLPERVSERRVIAPPVDVYENDEEILVVADLPGVTRDNLRIDFEDNRLTIEASRAEKDERTWLFREQVDADYRRSFEVAPGIDVDNIKATLEGGVLSVHLPKSPELRPRKIPITTG